MASVCPQFYRAAWGQGVEQQAASWGRGWKMGSKAEETGAPLRAFTHPAARRLRYLCRKPFIFSSHHVGWDPVLCAGSQKNPNF